jgi:hypothetical protein
VTALRSFVVVLVVVLIAVGAAGCPGLDPSHGLNTTAPDQFLDYNTYVCNVMPVLVKRCSYTACHGNELHALRVYSPGKLRLGNPTTRMARDAIPTADEVELNFESASGIVLAATAAERNPPDVQKVLLLGKPLKASAGGAEHHGVGIFPTYPNTDPNKDPEFQALLAWVAGAKTSATQLPTDCANLFKQLKLTPR